MFAYEKDGKICILMTGNKPVASTETPDVVIKAVDDGEGNITAKILINGREVQVSE